MAEGEGHPEASRASRAPRRLLAMNHFANPLHAPGGTRMVELCDRLDGWETTIVASDRNLFTQRRQYGDGTRFRTVWTTPYGGNDSSRVVSWAVYAAGAWLLGMALPRPDVVLASSPHLLTGLAGWAVARVRGVPFVLEIRDLWPQILVDTGRLDEATTLFRVVAGLESFLYARADAIIVLAQGVADSIIASGIAADRVHLVPNAADPEDFMQTEPREVLRRRFGFDGLTIIYAGAHGPANGLDFVLDAAAELRDELPEVRFVLVGDGLAKPALMDRAQRERLDNVVFLQPVPKSEMVELLGAADAGLHVLDDLPLFKYGVSPNKLFDYMAAGLPVLTNTGGEIGALVEREQSGIVVEPGALAAGARALAATDAGERTRCGARGRAFMGANQSRTLAARKLAAVLDAVWARGQRSRGSTRVR